MGGARTTTVRHRVPFYETDAMGIVHHANYAHYLEVARIAFLDEHDQPYRLYVEQGLHFAVTSMEIRYHRSASYDDVVETTVWVEQVGGASLRMAYEIRCAGELLATAATGHAMVGSDGRPRRIPADRRAMLKALPAAGA